MANARERAKTQRERQREYHLARIEAAKAKGRGPALAAAWALFLSDFKHCTNEDTADRIGAKVFQTLIEESAKLPRREIK